MARGMYRVSSLWDHSSQLRLPSCLSRLRNLVEEDVLAIPSLGRKFLQIAILIDPMFLT
jgi:hypothetical protein